MSNSSAEDAFEKGAGTDVSGVLAIFDGMLGFFTLAAVMIIILGSYVAWRNGQLKFEDLTNFVIRAIVFLVVVAGFILYVKSH